MCGSSLNPIDHAKKLGKAFDDVNPVKMAKNPKKATKDFIRGTEDVNVGYRVNESLGLPDYINGRDKAKERAAEKMRSHERGIADDRRAQLEAYNNDVIAQKRRRRAGSVLSRAGSGMTDATNSVLAAAATYGKQTTGA